MSNETLIKDAGERISPYSVTRAEKHLDICAVCQRDISRR